MRHAGLAGKGYYVVVTNTKLSTFGKKGLVVSSDDDKAVVLFEDNKKMEYSRTSVQLLEKQTFCTLVVHKGNEYLVTPKDTIVSLRTNRIMKWGDEHPTRREILNDAYIPE